MTWFTGTSTGNRYEVGRSYSMGGDSWTAQADGTFKNSEGRSVVGSSQSPNVQWGGGTSLGGNSGGGGGGAERPYTGTGAGHEHVASGGGSPTQGPGNRGAVSGGVKTYDANWRVPRGPGRPERTTPIFMGGNQLGRDLGFSDVGDVEERWGDSEFLSPTWFAAWGVFGADMLANAGVNTPKLAQDVQQIPEATASGAVDLSRYLDQRRETVVSEREAAAMLRALEESRDGAGRGVDTPALWKDPAKQHRELGNYP